MSQSVLDHKSLRKYFRSIFFSVDLNFFLIYAVVLCPLSVIDGWVSEIEKFAPKLRVLSYVGEKEHRRRLRRTMYEHVQAQSSSNNVWSRHAVVFFTHEMWIQLCMICVFEVLMQ